MPKPNEFLLKHLMDVVPKSTSHGVGVKRVMATSNEVGTPITQVAHTLLRKGEVVEEHFHPTMDEHFFFLEGKCDVNNNGDSFLCKKGDYLYVPSEKSHKLTAIEDTIMLTIGVAK